MPIDKKLISRKITLINNDLKSLKALSKLSLKTYLSKSEIEKEIPADFYNSFIARRDDGQLGRTAQSLGARI